MGIGEFVRRADVYLGLGRCVVHVAHVIEPHNIYEFE